MKRYIFLGVGLVVVGLSVWGYIWWHSPAETKEFTTKSTAEKVLGSEQTLTDWNTSYFSTRYPSDLRIITSNEVAHGITSGQYLLGSISLDRTDQLAVTVGNLGGLALDELPAIKFRKQNQDTYQSISEPFTPEGGIAFEAPKNYEISVFWKNGGRYAAAVVSGSSARQENLQQQLEAVVKNWQWK